MLSTITSAEVLSLCIEDLSYSHIDFEIVNLVEKILSKVSGILNTVISLDPDFIEHLQKLHGSTVRVVVLGLDLQFDCVVAQTGITVRQSGIDDRCQVELSGPPLSLLRLLWSDNQLQSSLTGDVQIKGDAQLARQLAEVIRKLDIDWEGVLAEKIGNIPAHQTGEWLRSILQWRKHLHDSWQAAGSEFLREESRLLPTRIETEHFMDEVDSLHEAVQRLEARLHALHSQTDN